MALLHHHLSRPVWPSDVKGVRLTEGCASGESIALLRRPRRTIIALPRRRRAIVITIVVASRRMEKADEGKITHQWESAPPHAPTHTTSLVAERPPAQLVCITCHFPFERNACEGRLPVGRDVCRWGGTFAGGEERLPVGRNVYRWVGTFAGV